MRRLATRLATTGARGQVLLTTVGIAIGAALLLTISAVPGAISARHERASWRQQAAWTTDADAATRMSVAVDEFDGLDIARVDVHQRADASVVLPGVDSAVTPGTVALSPALAELIEREPPDLLGDRFPGRPTATIDPDTLAHPVELVAFVGVDDRDDLLGVTAFGVVAFDPTLDTVTTILVGVAAVVVIVPIAIFLGSTMRLSTARRERRLANMRLVGATMGDVRRLVVGETVTLSLIGVAGGGVLFWLTRSALSPITSLQRTLLTPSDLDPPLWGAAAVVVGIPLLVTAVGLVALRRVRFSPLGVSRSAPAAAPSVWRLLPVGVGLVGMAVTVVAATGRPGEDGAGPNLWMLLVSLCVVMAGLLTGGAWITSRLGRALATRGERASTLLAGRRLHHDPRAGYRAVVAAVLALFSATLLYTTLDAVVSSGVDTVSGLRSSGVLLSSGDGQINPGVADRIANIPDVRSVAGVEAVDGPTSLWVGDCAAASRVVVLRCTGDASSATYPHKPGDVVEADDGRTFTIPDDVADLGDAFAVYAPSALVDGDVRRVNRLLVDGDGSARTLERIRTVVATSPGAPEIVTDALFAGERAAGISTTRLIIDAALLTTLVVAGVSLAVTLAGSVLERRVAFSLLRMSGTRLSELRRVVVLEAVVPLLTSALLGITLGYVTAAVILHQPGEPLPSPGAAVALRLVAGLAAAVSMTTLALPLLRRVTTTEQTRFG